MARHLAELFDRQVTVTLSVGAWVIVGAFIALATSLTRRSW